MIAVERELSGELKRLGFIKKSRTWWRSVDDVIQVINLQRGFGEQLFINVAAYFTKLGTDTFPKEFNCHVRARLERIARAEYFTPIRSLEAGSEPMPEAIRALSLDGIAWLNQIANTRGFCKFLESEVANQCFIHHAARNLCKEKHVA
jgi:hypothetical protein